MPLSTQQPNPFSIRSCNIIISFGIFCNAFSIVLMTHSNLLLFKLHLYCWELPPITDLFYDNKSRPKNHYKRLFFGSAQIFLLNEIYYSLAVKTTYTSAGSFPAIIAFTSSTFLSVAIAICSTVKPLLCILRIIFSSFLASPIAIPFSSIP